MAAPYWGNLDPPVGSQQNSNRRQSNGNEQYPSQLPQPRVNRASIQSQVPTVSTLSPFASPTASSFRGDGLAPRPPSFPYGQRENPDREFVEKRRRRASRDTEDYYDIDAGAPPPPAPDAPRAPPPVSYKQPYRNGGSAAYQVPSRSNSRAVETTNDPADFYRQQPLKRIDTGGNTGGTQRSTNSEYRRDRNSAVGQGSQGADGPDSAGIRRGSVSARKEKPEYHDPATEPRSRKGSAAESETQRRREWAPDRSPLQRLELTLDSITKEEKRARVEEAELLAREAKAGRGGDRINQNSVRSRNRGAASQPIETKTQPGPQTLPEAGLVRSLSNKQKGELQRSGTIEKTRPAPADSAATGRLGRGFEYQPQPDSRREAEFDHSPRDIEPSSAPQRGSSFRERAAAPLIGAATGAATGAALGRSGSKKLKKEPPGDPWFNKRTEAEKNFKEVVPRKESLEARREANAAGGGPLGSAPVNSQARNMIPDPRVEPRRQAPPAALEDPESDSEEDLYPSRPVRRNPMSKIEQLTGQKVNNKPLKDVSVRRDPMSKIEQLTGQKINQMPQRGVSPQQQQLYADRLDRSEELGPEENQRHQQAETRTQIKTVNGIRYAVAPEVAAGNFGQESAARGPDGHHHFSNIIHPGHLHRDQFRPGDGLYKPSPRLADWKKAGVAALTGTLLDLEVKQTEAEKDKAWWEAGHKSKRRSSTAKRGKVDPYDGGYEDKNGTILLILSSESLGDGEDNVLRTVSIEGEWRKNFDPVVPGARRIIGFEGTSENKAKVKRRNRSWLTKPPMVVRPDSNSRHPNAADTLSSATALLSSYSSDCHKISNHNIFHPFHVCLTSKSRTKRLTPAMRSIRVRSFTAPTQFSPQLHLKCGPLLRYTGLRREAVTSRPGHSGSQQPREIWRGSVMIVTTDTESSYDSVPTLRLFAQPLDLSPPPPAQVDGGAEELAPEYVDPIAGLPKIGRDGKTLYVRPVEQLEEEKDLSKDETDNGLFETQRSVPDVASSGQNDGVTDPKDSFAGRSQRGGQDGQKLGKFVDVKGFRLHAEQGVTFWRFNIEVEMRNHQQRIAYRINRGPSTGFWVPAKGQTMNIMFHSCNGFSLSVNPDQFSGPDPMWRDVLNTHQTQPFHVMLGGGDQIYNDAVTQSSNIFSEWLSIKNPLHKHNAPFTREMQQELEKFYLDRYSMWFSQGLFGLANSQIPMVNIFDDHDIIDGFGSYPHHFMDSPVFSGLGAIAFKYYLLFQHQSIIDEGEDTEPSWLLGIHPGPYMKELSRSVFMFLGSSVAFLGLDCRTERSREDVVSDDTYAKVFDRMHEEIVKGETKHLIVLLGVPIAYPRLVWLENILTSRIMVPVKYAGKSGMFGKLLNQFDGGVEILDDLDDHWTAKNHKAERNWFIEELQDLAAEKSVRVTILGGDVHLAAMGQFYSNRKLGIPKDKDHRYMPNIISSAIVNTPPPEMMADVLNKRNKVHHLNHETDEDMIPIFTHDVTGAKRNNKRLLPRRNWCSIREYNPEMTPPPTPVDERSSSPPPRGGLLRRLSTRRGPSYRPDAGPPPSRSLMRTLSLQRGRPSTETERPGMRQRSLSWSNDFKPGNLFRRFSRRRRPDDGINGYGSETDEGESPYSQPSPTRMRGGAGDEGYFPRGATANAPAPFTRTRIGRNADLIGPNVSNQRNATARDDTGYTSYDDTPDEQHVHVRSRDRLGSKEHHTTEPAVLRRPFHRTPTGMSEKQRRIAGPEHEINLEGGLDICLNVEVSQKDPAGITVPYRLLVPALWHEDSREDLNHAKKVKKGTGLSRLMSFGRGKQGARNRSESFSSQGEGEGEMEEQNGNERRQ